MVGADVGVRAGVVDGFHDIEHVQVARFGQVRGFAEVMVAQELDVANVHRADAVHLAEVADDGRNVVVRRAAQRAGAEADGVRGAVMELDNLVEILLAMRNARQPENRPRRVIGMARHADANFLADRNHSVEEVLVVRAQVIGRELFVLAQGRFQQRQTLRLPAGQREALRIGGGAADDFHRAHFAQILLVEVQGVRAVLRDDTRQVGAQPVKDGHEVVDDDLHAVLRQRADGRDVVGNIFVARGQTHLDVLVDIDGLDHFQLQSSGVDFLHQRLDLLFRPVDTGGLIQQTHQTGHARNLLHILQRNRVGLAAIPAECHFHGDVSSFCFAKPPVFAAMRQVYFTINFRKMQSFLTDSCEISALFC